MKPARKTNAERVADLVGMKHIDPHRTQHKKALAHEARVAKERGGRTLANSGSRPNSRHDARTAAADLRDGRFLIQHKATSRGSYSVTRDELLALCEGAQQRGLKPLFMILFEAERRCPAEWVLLPRPVFEAMEVKPHE